MKALILAGGFATRLWPLTEKRAKPLLLLNGKPLISHIVEKIPTEISLIISTNQVFQEDFLKWQQSYPDRKIEIFIEDSSTDDGKKGALGATSLVIREKKIQEDLILIAGDNYFAFNFQDFLNTFQGNPLIAVYDVKETQEASKYGVVNLNSQNKQVESFEEKPLEPKSTLVSTGVYIFPKTNLEDVIFYAESKKDDLGGVFEYFLNTKKQIVDCFAFEEGWYDIGSFKAYLEAHQVLQNGKIVQAEGVKLLGKTELQDSVYLGRNTTIQNSLIANSLILDDCVIQNCVIRDSIIDQNSSLNNIDLTQKMIREGSIILN